MAVPARAGAEETVHVDLADGAVEGVRVFKEVLKAAVMEKVAAVPGPADEVGVQRGAADGADLGVALGAAL
jgi:uncharacterized protein YunC (DUF1805 family)